MNVFAFSIVALVVLIFCSSLVASQTESREESSESESKIRRVLSGRYVPELHGTGGKYKVDLRGKYIHKPVPYNGGYGDRGLRYEHDDQFYENGYQNSWQSYDEFPEVTHNGSPDFGDRQVYDDSDQVAQGIQLKKVTKYLKNNWYYFTGSDNGSENWLNQALNRFAVKVSYDPRNSCRIIRLQWEEDGEEKYSYVYKLRNNAEGESEPC